MKAVTLTYHLLMCFPTKERVEEVRGDKVIAQECYVAFLKGESTLNEAMSIDSLEVRDERTWTVVEPRGELEDVILNVKYPDHVTRVGLNLSKDFKR